MSSPNMPLAQLFAVEPENDWRMSAACRDMDPDLFFSSEQFENKHEKEAREQTAKAVCDGCRVTSECLDYAFQAGERYGIWGGLTEQERRALARRRSAAARAERVS